MPTYCLVLQLKHATNVTKQSVLFIAVKLTDILCKRQPHIVSVKYLHGVYVLIQFFFTVQSSQPLTQSKRLYVAMEKAI